MFIAIPFFKNAFFLREALASLLAQTDEAWRALVLDDAIDERESVAAKEVVDSLGDARIKYHKNAVNLGMARNWNQAFRLAAPEEFLMILHADDQMLPNYLTEMKKLTREFPHASAYFCQVEIIGRTGASVFSFADFYKKRLLPSGKRVQLRGERGIERLISGNFIFCPTLVYRVCDFQSEPYRTDLKMVLDFELILRSLQAGQEWIGYYDHALFQYRRHDQNTTVRLTENLDRFREEIALYSELSKRLQDSGNFSLAKKAGKMRIIGLNLLFQMMKSLLALRFRAFFSQARLLLQLL